MKKQPNLLLALTLTLILIFHSCKQPAMVDEAEVTRIVSTLAADDMEGRRAFTPGIDKAAAFIESEFKKIGLEYLDGLDSYQQQFSMYSIRRENVDAKINGTIIDAGNVITMVNAASFELSAVADADLTYIAPGMDFRGAINQVRRRNGKRIVLAHTSHKGIFDQYKGFFSRANRVMEMNAEDGMIVVLTDIKAIRNVDIKVTNKVEEQALANVAGKITGNRSNEIVLFSGHYDHLGIRGAEGDTIYNGANDDASGTTAVITLAQYFKDMGTKPERTIIFAAFTAEEMGGYGSTYFSQQLNPDEIVAMFNIEMIGKPAVSGPNTAWITGFDKSDFGTLLQQAVEGTEYEFYADPYPSQNLFYRSDNATLARLGVPAHTISTTPIDVDKDYHQASDEVSTLDMAHMTNTIKAIAAAAERIISGTDTPTRVDPAGLN